MFEKLIDLLWRVWEACDVDSFMSERLEDQWIRSVWRERWWWFAHRFLPWHIHHYIYIGLPPGYYEPEDKILHASFQQLLNFIETEEIDEESLEEWKKLDLEDWEVGMFQDRQAFHEELLSLKNWWLTRQERLDRLYDVPEELEGVDHLREKSPEYGAFLDESYQEEERLAQEDDEMLIRLVKVRRGMWS